MKKHARDLTWLLNSGQMSPEVQNRGISGPTKMTFVCKKFTQKNNKKKTTKKKQHYLVSIILTFRIILTFLIPDFSLTGKGKPIFSGFPPLVNQLLHKLVQNT